VGEYTAHLSSEDQCNERQRGRKERARVGTGILSLYVLEENGFYSEYGRTPPTYSLKA
jgi:hypothetical protein